MEKVVSGRWSVVRIALVAILAVVLTATLVPVSASAGAPNLYEQCAGYPKALRNECVIGAFKFEYKGEVWNGIDAAAIGNYKDANPWLDKFSEKVNRVSPNVSKDDVVRGLIVFNYIQGDNYRNDLRLPPNTTLPQPFWGASYVGFSERYRLLFDVSPSIFRRVFSDGDWRYACAYVSPCDF